MEKIIGQAGSLNDLVDYQEGEIIIMPANNPHALKATERFKMMLVMVRA